MISNRSVERLLSIFDAFRLERKPLGLEELSKRTDLSKPTLLRYLRTMENQGYIISYKENNTFFLTPIFLDLSNLVLDNFNLRDTLIPIMKDIKDKCNETVNLYVLNGYQRVCIEQVESDQMIKKYSKIGDVMPLHSGAAGKVFLAYSSEEFVKELLENVGLTKYTNNTITDIKLLWEELRDIREKGYSTSKSEREENIISVAVPIFDFNDNLTSVMTISGPSYRLEDKMETSAKLLLEGIKSIK